MSEQEPKHSHSIFHANGINSEHGSELLRIISSTDMSTSSSDDEDQGNIYYEEDVCLTLTEYIDATLRSLIREENQLSSPKRVFEMEKDLVSSGAHRHLPLSASNETNVNTH